MSSTLTQRTIEESRTYPGPLSRNTHFAQLGRKNGPPWTKPDRNPLGRDGFTRREDEALKAQMVASGNVLLN